MIESEIAANVYRIRELHEAFSSGSFEELNDFYSDEFKGWLYMPGDDDVQFYNAEQIRAGNKAAAGYYQGKKIKFTFTGLKIVPQSKFQAAVSYEVIFQSTNNMVRAISLEVWRKESDGKWRILRWYEEKGVSETI